MDVLKDLDSDFIAEMLFLAEQSDMEGISPFKMVEFIQERGATRTQAVELWRQGTLAWIVQADPFSEEV